MRQLRITLIIVLSVMALSVLAFLVSVISGGFALNWSFNGDFDLNSYKIVSDTAYPSEGIKTVDTSLTYDEIDVLRNETDEIRIIQYSLNDLKEDELARISASGAKLTIREGNRSNVLNLASRVEIYLPEDYGGSLTIKTTSGSIELKEDFELTELTLGSSSGSIRFNEANAGDIRLESTSGSIRGDMADCSGASDGQDGAVSIRASAGSINVGNIAGSSVAISSTSGSIKSEELNCTGEVSVGASSGSVNINNMSGNNISVRTTSGSIRGSKLICGGKAEIAASSGSVRFDEINGYHTIKTTSASINISSASGGGVYEASSGSIRTNFYSVSGDISINATSGSVNLTLPGEQSISFSAKSNSGSVNLEFDGEVSWIDKYSHFSEGSIGSDPKYTLKLRTSSGSIRVSQN